MKLAIETKLKDFEFWGGAADNVAKLTDADLDTLEEILEELGPLSPTELNDFMWFDFERACEWLDLDYDKVVAGEY